MRNEKEFISQIEGLIKGAIGDIIGRSILKNSASKLDKDIGSFTIGDCKTLAKNILKAVSVFATKEETGRIEAELESLINMYCA